MQRVVQSLENFDSIYNPELMIFVKSNLYLILMIVAENIREETLILLQQKKELDEALRRDKEKKVNLMK